MKPKEIVFHFQGGLADSITAFIEEKHRLGYKYMRESYELLNLDRFSLDHECSNCLPEELVMAWTQRQPNHSAATTNFKITVIRELAKFMARNSCEAFEYPPGMAPKPTHEHTPYIFTHEEIRRLFDSIDHMKPRCESPKRHIIYPVLFRLLYCCGLRASEALHLSVSDVDIEGGVLLIRNAKAYNDRLVPLEASVLEKCAQYKQQLHSSSAPEQCFFPAPDGYPYHIFSVRTTFRDLLWASGISYGGRLVGPRMHDLRHTFAVHSLQKAVAQGKDPQEVIPVLATYLGHKTCEGTYRYLHMTAEMFPEMLERIEAACGQLMPTGVNT